METQNIKLASLLSATDSKAIAKLQGVVTNSGEKRLQALIELGAIVTRFKASFEEAKQAKKVTGSVTDAVIEVFGYQKSFAAKLCRVSQIPTETVTAFLDECRKDKNLALSVESLLTFAKSGVLKDTDTDTDTDTDETPKVTEKPVLTFTARLSDLGLGGNVSLRILPDGTVVTTATAEDIEAAIKLLQAALQPAEIEA